MNEIKRKKEKTDERQKKMEYCPSYNINIALAIALSKEL